MFERDNRGFYEKLALGIEKEIMLTGMLNWSGFKARRNNEESVTDIDIELIDDNIYIDAKFMETPFHKAFQYTGIQPENCLTLQTRHIKNYADKERTTGKEVWVGCFINYADYNVHELLFFKNSKLKQLVDKQPSAQKLHFNRKEGISFSSFLNYLNINREMKGL